MLGSLIYEIVAWVKPSERGGITEIEEKLAQEVFPRLEGVVAGKAIERYWHGKREMSAETVAELQMIERGKRISCFCPSQRTLSSYTFLSCSQICDSTHQASCF